MLYEGAQSWNFKKFFVVFTKNCKNSLLLLIMLGTSGTVHKISEIVPNVLQSDQTKINVAVIVDYNNVSNHINESVDTT